MISTKTSSLFPKQGDQNAKRTEKHIDKEQGKTKHEAPRSVNYRATQNKNNIGTTALEQERRNFSFQFSSSSCDQHTLSKLSHRIFS